MAATPVRAPARPTSLLLMIGALRMASTDPRAADGYIPPGAAELRGLFIEQWGARSLGVPAWLEFAKQNKFAIYAPPLAYDGAIAERLVDTALPAWAKSQGHPELIQAPFCAFGGSTGGWISMMLTDRYPDRMIAADAGFHGIWPQSNAVPVVMPINELDENFYHPPAKTIQQDFQSSYFPNRARGARWSLAVRWGWKPHGTPEWQDLGMLFFDRVMRRRLPAGASPAQGPVALESFPAEEGWLSGLLASSGPFPALYPYAEYPGPKDSAVWLPDRYFAWAWRAFISVNTAIKITKPEPYVHTYNGQPSADCQVPLLTSRTVALEAAPAGDSAAVAKVRWYDGDRFLAEAADPPYAAAADLDPGVHALIAIAISPSGDSSSSMPRIVVVQDDGLGATIRAPARARALAGDTRISNPSGHGARLRIYDLAGALRLSRDLAPAPAFDLRPREWGLPRGLYRARLSFPGGGADLPFTLLP